MRHGHLNAISPFPTWNSTVARQGWRHFLILGTTQVFARRTSLHRASNAPCPARVRHGTRNALWGNLPTKTMLDAACAPAAQIVDVSLKSSGVNSCRDKLIFFHSYARVQCIFLPAWQLCAGQGDVSKISTFPCIFIEKLANKSTLLPLLLLLLL